MKLFTELENVNAFTYNRFSFRILLALVAAFLVTSYNEEKPLTELFQLKGYFIFLLFFFLMAVIIIEVVHEITCRFDKNMPWFFYPVRRFLFQILGGVMLPLVLTLVLTILYFSLHGLHILETDFLDEYFSVTVVMVFLLNVYYLAGYLIKGLVKAFMIKKIQVKLPRVLKRDWVTDDIALIVSNRGGCFVYTYNHEKMGWSDTLEATMAQLPDQEYFLINRSVILHRDNVFEINESTSRRSQLTLNVPKGEVVYVSQRHTADFKEWIRVYKGGYAIAETD